MPQAAKLPGTSDFFKKNYFLRKSSAPGSEAARDKWFVQKKVPILRISSAPGSEVAQDKWFVQKKVHCLRKSSAPGSEVARDKWLLQKKCQFFEKNILHQAAKLPRTSGLFEKIC